MEMAFGGSSFGTGEQEWLLGSDFKRSGRYTSENTDNIVEYLMLELETNEADFGKSLCIFEALAI